MDRVPRSFKLRHLLGLLTCALLTCTEARPADPDSEQRARSAATKPSSAARQPLWESPTAGKPIEFAYVPAGSQALVHWRVQALLKHPEAEKVLDALGSLGDWLRTTLPAQSGVPLDQIERVVLALLSAEGGTPPMVGVVYSDRPIATKMQTASVDDGDNRGDEPKGLDLAYSYPSQVDDRVVVFGPPAQITEIAASSAEPLALRRELEELRGESDDQRLFTLLCPPSYWQIDGKVLLGDQQVRALDWLSWFFGRSAQAGLLSLHLDDSLFVELRLYCAADKKPAVFAQEYRQRVGQLSARVNSELQSRPLSAYDEKVLKQFPSMLQRLDEYTRADVQGRQIILRSYLPEVAAHNLLFATRLFFESPSGGQLAVNKPSNTDKPAPIAMRLTKTISLTFPRKTLEDALRLFTAETDVAIEIRGADLQREGITRNQSFALDEKDRPAADVLMAILLKASPEGKLTYQIQDDPAPGVLVVTTKTNEKQPNAKSKVKSATKPLP